MPKRQHDMNHWSYRQAVSFMEQGRQYRRMLKLTQAQLNEKMGFSQSGISEMENGHHPMYSMALYLRYWAAMGMRVSIRLTPMEEDE
jgi:transcriptional regulator with XRE-family HTH domain